MALFRRFFYRKPPDHLLEISERVYVFDCCFSAEVLEEDEYKVYMGGIVAELQDYYHDSSFMVFNFTEGDRRTQISDILSQYDMTVMEYPRQYEGCPMLPLEMIGHFLRSCESWLSLEGQQNVLLMHCERGGWPVLAFMLAALLLFRKQYTGEQKTLEMVYKQAPRELLRLLTPLNAQPSQLRYLQYISRRNLGSDWPPSDTPLALDCIILRFVPLFGEKDCTPVIRIYGQDSSSTTANRGSKLLYTSSKTKIQGGYFQAEVCEVVKIDINHHIQGDVILECVYLDDVLEEMIFRVMFHTTFVRSNILILSCHEVDVRWGARSQMPMNFKAEVCFSDVDALPSMKHEEFYEVEEIFVVPPPRYDVPPPPPPPPPPGKMLSRKKIEANARVAKPNVVVPAAPPPPPRYDVPPPAPPPPPPPPPPGKMLNRKKIEANARVEKPNVVVPAAPPPPPRYDVPPPHPPPPPPGKMLGRKKIEANARVAKPNVVVPAAPPLPPRYDVPPPAPPPPPPPMYAAPFPQMMAPFLKEFEHLKIQLEDIKSATDNFGENKVIGRGGFGKVYLGEVSHSEGKRMGAFKRLDPSHGQGDPEFWKEILMLSDYKHENLISLLGFCDEGREKILVYEYASNGSLDRHLSSTHLTWRQRIQICIDAARGLRYLHDDKGKMQRVLHRDIKSSNILLDNNWNAKVSDMGLSKTGPANQPRTFVITRNIVGTPGYCDPQYMNSYTLSKESDVYSFGVVLFEVLCGRLCYKYSNGQLDVLVPTWKKAYKQKRLHEIVFQGLTRPMDSTSLETFSGIAFQCLLKSRDGRPKMADVVEKLETALEFEFRSEVAK